jgi:transmembrane protein TMEM220
MRYVFAVVALAMLLFVAVQYNDPDGPLWMVYYGVPAIWAGIAALRPHWLGAGIGRTLLAASVAAFVVLTILYWPPVSGFWHEETWRMSGAVQGDAIAEQSREGMGLMIATAVVVAVFAASFATRSRPALQGR